MTANGPEALTIVGSALTIISALVVGGIWLMKQAFRFSQQNLQSKKELYAERVRGLKEVVTNLNDRLDRTEKDIENVVVQLETTASILEETKNLMVTYIESSEEKLEVFERRILQLSNDLIIIKSKQRGH